MTTSAGSCGCHVQKVPAPAPSASAESQMVALRIHGMGCANCANRVHNGLLSAPGVTFVHVDLPSSTAAVRIDPRRIRPDTLPDIVARAGEESGHRYEAAVIDVA
ncbi:MAG: heavy-metal-associated domain-containing protein [Gemmatimonadaceae bacterium]|nr:heavy-metal-associated domain-containing protein [Gemmatimonadaceae bacterium]